MITKRLMSSVSSVAIVVAGAQQASADAHSALSGYTLNVQGGIAGIDNIWDDKTGSEDLSDKVGSEDNLTSYMGSLTLSRETSPNKDMAFGLSFGVSPQADSFRLSAEISNSDSETLLLASEQSNSYAALDFEMGTTVPMGTADMRWFYGARALASKSNFSYDFEVDKAGSGSGGSLEVEAEAVFVGVGPRVGIGFATQPAPSSKFGFSGELGAAVLFGSRKDTVTVNALGFPGSGGSSSFSEQKNVASLDAQIGVDYYLSDNATISAGYQLQQLWNVDFASDEDNPNFASSRLIHGVFVGFTTQF